MQAMIPLYSYKDFLKYHTRMTNSIPVLYVINYKNNVEVQI